ncbi:TetR/AcrR family transcriptional regulator [Natronohydrobacter thiooxidans]|uniref:TetR/AcrR family transcriptional regulator n=1 Tax=Natronohydrobacter thiooxidans TaxID=87172 RepID=UPI0008FF6F36|nr:TetR/AcrR family transcriptional regulator [Natronohydrobacter thiooxidans]
MARIPRDELRTRLIGIAEARICADGISGLRARDLAREAGCALGAIYNVFADLNQLVLAVNGRTFLRLGDQVRRAVAAQPDAAPVAQLIAMAESYRAFAIQNRNAWLALFDLRMSSEADVPAWYWQEMAALFEIIAAPLRQLHPERSPEDLDLLVRTLFSAVHGIVLLGVEKRISGVPDDRVAQMLALLIAKTAAPDP